MTAKELPQEEIEVVEDEKIVLPLSEAVTNVANAYHRYQEAQAKLASKRYEMIQAIRNNPELQALQESIDIAENHAKQLEGEYSLAKVQVKESTLSEWQDGMNKTFFEGLLQVRVLSNSVLHWDAGKALNFALNAPENVRATLLSADKNGFKKLHDVIEIPADVIQIGESLTVAISEGELINHIDMSVYDHEKEESLPDNTPKKVSDLDEARRDAYFAQTPF